MAEEGVIRVLKALSDPTRLSIFEVLMEGVHCNCEIAARLGVSLNLISHHVNVLSDAGLVRRDRAVSDARWIYYTIDQDAVRDAGVALSDLLDVTRIRPRLPACDVQMGRAPEVTELEMAAPGDGQCPESCAACIA